MTQQYDIIGDIHGYAQPLERLLQKLGYRVERGCYRHPEGRKVVFLGDFIDRGTDIKRTLEIVMAMHAEGEALAVMGNHEFNCLAWEAGYREHDERNTEQYEKTLKFFEENEGIKEEILDWFRQLPIWLELDDFIAVHACYDADAVAALGESNRITDPLLKEASEKSTAAGRALNVLLKGKEADLPEGQFFTDVKGSKHKDIRLKWWLDARGKTYQEMLFPECGKAPEIPIPAKHIKHPRPYPADAKPVFIGHYWLPPEYDKKPIAPNIACLDYSIAKQGLLMAYRWNGETSLNENNYLWVQG